ncbi:alpha/beta-hydrolase [Hypomontagnella monticulosa]|nr:alpha/beta-hydrolase [Hypomontagnella monticulosa]
MPRYSTSALLALVSAAVPLAASPLYGNSSIQWKECPTALAAPGSKVKCGSVAVPLDWDNPHRGSINIGLAKLPARKPENRIGNLFYQPGGPGNPGTDKVVHVETGATRWGDDLLDNFDLIGVDIRGTGLSNPLKCDADLYNERLPAYPLTDEEFEARVKRNRALRQSCIDMTGIPLVDYTDTVSIAKDHEAVRLALGGEPMNWFGVSYGTLLGAQYAELFPENIRSIMLDGVASLSQSEIATFTSAALGVETAFRGFLTWCKAQNATACPMAYYDPSKPLEQVWLDFMARVQEKPLPCSDSKFCRHPEMTVDEIREHAFPLIYGESFFPYLSEAIGHALNENDASVFATYALQLTSPSESRTVYNNSAAYSNLAVVCQDWYHDDKSAEDIKVKHMIAMSHTPLMMGFDPTYRLFQVNCIGWPAPTRNPPHKISIPRTARMPTVLMVESLRDPATPLSWSAQMRSEIGTDRTVMIAKNMTGHAVYEQPGTVGGEIAAVMEQYLLKLALPVEGTIYQS